MQQMDMMVDLYEEVSKLAQYYNRKNIVRKNLKNEKLREKHEHKFRQLTIEIKPPRFFDLNYIYLTDGPLLIPSNPTVVREAIMGEIRHSYESLSSKIYQIQYNHKEKWVHVQLETLNLQYFPIGMFKNRFNSYADEVALSAKQLLEKVGEDTYKREIDRIPQLVNQDWLDSQMSLELPCVILRVEVHSSRFQLSYVYNHQFLNLVGLVPKVFIDTLMSSQRIPEIILEKEIFLWSSRVENMMKSHEGTVKVQYKTMLMTFEGQQVGAIVHQTFSQTFCNETQKHILIQKQEFQILNQTHAKFLNDQNRIIRNSEAYLKENRQSDKSQKISSQFEFDTDADMLAKTNDVKPCGFKNVDSSSNE